VTDRHDDDEDESELVWLPEAVEAAHPYFGFHEGQLALFVGCSGCGFTTRADPTLFAFVACERCSEDIPIAWNVGIA